MLSSRDIQKWLQSGGLVIDPLGEKSLQPASVDLHLSNEFCLVGPSTMEGRPLGLIDPRLQPTIERGRVYDEFLLRPGGFVLGSTVERVVMPVGLVGELKGKSSLARYGLMIHVTAGFIDPGFEGNITLELYNVMEVSWLLLPGMPIAQLAFARMDSEPLWGYGEGPYGGKYQRQTGPTASRMYQEFERELENK